jgi:UDP-N-acetylmuramate dehydrogenase
MSAIETKKILAPYTTFRIGGIADFFVKAKSVADLVNVSQFLKEKTKANTLPWVVLGGGANMLIADDGFRGLVIKNEILGIKVGSPYHEGIRWYVDVEAGAGELWDDFVAFTVARGCFGLENLSFIPGTVGASPVQNVGAYGAEVSSFILRVEAFDMKTGKEVIFNNEECHFGYRMSVFKAKSHKHFIITKVVFKLRVAGTLPHTKPTVNCGYKDVADYFKGRESSSITPQEMRDAVISIRKRKLPNVRTLGTVGSFFLNPVMTEEAFKRLKRTYPALARLDLPVYREGDKVKLSLAFILDKLCGLNGWRLPSGVAGLYETQPLAVVNFGGATAHDIVEVAQFVAKKVEDMTGITIAWEVEQVGKVC